jgi:hypothetical protein
MAKIINKYSYILCIHNFRSILTLLLVTPTYMDTSGSVGGEACQASASRPKKFKNRSLYQKLIILFDPKYRSIEQFPL